MMKTRIVYLLGLLIGAATPTLAQGRFSVGLTAAPVLSHYNTRFTIALPDQNGQLVDQTYSFRSTRAGAIAGVVVQYALTPNWSLTTGAWFSYYRFRDTYPLFATSVPVVLSAVRVPFMVNYRLTQRRLSPYFSVGVVSSALWGKTQYKPAASSGLSPIEFKATARFLPVQPLVGAGVVYQIRPHVSLTVQPMLIWYLKPNDTYQRYVSYQLNGQTQLLYTF